MAEKELTVCEMGRKGGTALRDKIGTEGYQKLGRKGGAATLAKHGREHYQRIGRLGGSVTSEKSREQP